MSTLHVSKKTDPGVLPQSQALESASADNSGVGLKRDVDTGRATGRPDNRITGVQHDRGETSVGVGNQQGRHPLSPEPSGGQGASSRGCKAPPCSTPARVFVVDHHGHPTVPRHPSRERKLLTSGRVRSGHLTLAGGPSGGSPGGLSGG